MQILIYFYFWAWAYQGPWLVVLRLYPLSRFHLIDQPSKNKEPSVSFEIPQTSNRVRSNGDSHYGSKERSNQKVSIRHQ